MANGESPSSPPVTSLRTSCASRGAKDEAPPPSAGNARWAGAGVPLPSAAAAVPRSLGKQ
eukprot:15480308-Alexandrium_andersonii.AAC.1